VDEPEMDDRARRTFALIAELQRKWPSFQRHYTPDVRAATIDQILADRFPELSVEERIKMREQYIATPLRTPPKLTPDEDPIFYQIVQDLIPDVEEAALDAGFIKSRFFLDGSRPYFATLNTGVVNAVTARVPKTPDYVVFFEPQLISFAYRISAAVCMGTPDGYALLRTRNTTRAIEEHLQKNNEAYERFGECVLAYALTGQCTNVPARPTLRGDIYINANNLRDSMLAFVTAHEYGHILCGHPQNQPEPTSEAPLAESNVPYSWAEEAIADTLAVRLLYPNLDQVNDIEAIIRYSGAEAFLQILDIMDQAVSILATGSEAPLTVGSHPPVAYRIPIIRQCVIDIFEKRHEVQTNVYCAIMHEVIDFLWRETRSVLLKLHGQGTRPWGGWVKRPSRTSG
jgi:hypothetical protein